MLPSKRRDAKAGERFAECGKPIDFYSAILSATSATPRFVSEVNFHKLPLSDAAWNSTKLRMCRDSGGCHVFISPTQKDRR